MGSKKLRQHDNLTPLQAGDQRTKIRLRPRMMIALAIIFGFIPWERRLKFD